MSLLTVNHQTGRLTVKRLLVPLDGSVRSETALGPAVALSGALPAPLEFVSVAQDLADAAGLGARLADLAGLLGAGYQTRLASQVVPALAAAVAEQPDTLVCMTAHGRGRLPAGILGSVATRLLTATAAPIVMVGGSLDPSRRVTDGPVLACVDGTRESERVLGVAASWAERLSVPLWIATVSEPVPPALDDRPTRRRFGPHEPAAYLEKLVATWESRLAGVVPVVIFDPISPAAGLRRFLGSEMGGLLAVSTHARTGAARAVLGSVTASLIRTSPVPVLVVPPTYGASAKRGTE